MAGPRRLPLLIMALTLLPKLSGNEYSSGTTVVSSSQSVTESSSAAPTTSSPSDPSSSNTGDTSTPQRSTPSPGEITTAQLSATPTDSGTASPSLHPTTDTHSGSGSPSPELTAVSEAASLTSSPLRPQGHTLTPASRRNPGVVVAVCLVVSLVLIGSVVLAVRRCHRDTSEFLVLDEVSMASVSQQESTTPE
ncbi:putative protein TPRXL [Heterocephalus glaber]|uniref:Uncharacterized protein n=1 Tax=Heterocephalus glaber TaxID=10181 RepID=A0AAX6SB88_HETGA|nr:putative protein TPRXL [Heterocephalus glaber]